MSTPNAWPEVGFAIKGTEDPWTSERLAGVLDHLQTAFVAPVDAVQLDSDLPWVAVNADALLGAWKRSRNRAVTLRTAGVPGIRLHLSYWESISIYATPEAFKALGADALLGAVRRIAAAMPSFTRAYGTAVGNLGALWIERDWPWMPKSFGTELYWWQALSEAVYRPDFTREVLRAAPADRVDEWPDRAIELQVYDDPFRWDAPENLARLEACVRYLDANRRKTP